MKLLTRSMAALAASALFAGLASLPAGASTAPTLTLTGGSAIIGVSPGIITATASVPGSVSFSANGSQITSCQSVPTTTSAPYQAICSWTPSSPGPVTLLGTLIPTDSTTYQTVTSPTLNVKVAAPVQEANSNYPISLYVDTVVASGATGAIAPAYGGCQITNEFLLGQTIVFRVYGNDADLAGAPLTSLNVSSATVSIPGLSAPLTLSYGNHSGVAFWTAALKTGSTPGLYSTLGVINYKVTFHTISVPAQTKRVRAYRTVRQMVNHKFITKKVPYTKTIILRPTVPGATGTFQSSFSPASQVTLNALPA